MKLKLGLGVHDHASKAVNAYIKYKVEDLAQRKGITISFKKKYCKGLYICKCKRHHSLGNPGL